ncbi:MAG: DUF418 domain-containing protein [Paludibacter sp.]|nr:DUF418 domain-containing protein [Paludibacter sp.]
MSESSRLHVVDALRGFAIVSIMLLHNIEHFDYSFTPEGLPAWLKPIDQGIWDTLFFLFGGKSYAIFALLFGLTFFIQNDNQAKKGKDFRPRFAWRLLLLLGFGLINSAFYQGDILTIYAIIGFVLIPVAKLSNKTVFIIAVLLMLQPYEWINVIRGLQHPEMQMANPASWALFGKMDSYIQGNSIVDTWIGNLTNGKVAVLLWTWEAGRVFQTASLFMLGMLAGRKALFVNSPENSKFWLRTLLVAIVAFVPLFIIKSNVMVWVSSVAIHRPLELIVRSWSNVAFMIVLVSGFTLLYRSRALHKTFDVLSPFGRMSMSNYIMQSIVGSFIYYGFGLGLYRYTGATYSILIGVVLAILQGIFSNYWMKNHRQGPLETIWHKLTWISLKK